MSVTNHTNWLPATSSSMATWPPLPPCPGHEDGHLTEPCLTPLVRCGGLLCLHGIFHLQGSGDLFLGTSLLQFGDVFRGLIGCNEAIDLHRSPASPMVRWIWEPFGTTNLLRFLCRFSECFSSWIGDGKQVHVVVAERESALRTMIKEEMLQSAVITTMFPSSQVQNGVSIP